MCGAVTVTIKKQIVFLFEMTMVILGVSSLSLNVINIVVVVDS